MTGSRDDRRIDEIRDLAGKFKRMMSIEEGDNPVDEGRPGSTLGEAQVSRRLPGWSLSR